MNFIIIDVPVEKLDFSDELFKITTNVDIKSLSKSINHIGLLSYPYVIFKDNRYKIISGFRRLISCSNLGYKTISVKVLSNTTTQGECAIIAISDNTFQRQLNIIEISRCYRILKKYKKEIFNCFGTYLGKSLGFTLNKLAIKKIESVSLLDEALQEGLIEGYLSLSAALELGRMEKTNIFVFIDIFKKLKTTWNNQREIIELMMEISKKDNILLENLVNNKYIKEILHNTTSGSQKTNLLRTCLKNIRYPVITLTLNTFKKKLDKLNLHKCVKLIPPKFFEGLLYTLKITFRTTYELEKYKKELDKIINNPDILKTIL